MASRAVATGPGRWRVVWLLALLLSAAAAACAIAMLAGMRERAAAQWQSAGELPFRPEVVAGAGAVRVAVDDARQAWIWGAEAPRALHTFTTRIAALSVDAEAGRIYAGDGLGQLIVLDAASGKALATRQLPGRLTQLAALPGGALAACYGLSGYGPDHYVTLLSEPLAGFIGAGVTPNFCTRLMQADNAGGVWYATMHGRLGRVDVNGRLAGDVVLMQRPTALLSAPAGGMFALDRRGGLTLIGPDLTPTWNRKISGNALVAGALDVAEGTLLVADHFGALTLLDDAGHLLATWPARGFARIVDIAATPGRYVITHADGKLTSVPTAWGARSLPLRRTVAWALLATALLVIAWGATRAHSKTAAASDLLLKRIYRARAAYVMLLPTMALLAVFCYWPAVSALLYAFMQYSLTEPPRFVGLDNFRQLAHDPYVWVGMRNLVILVVTGIIKTLTMPLLAAELIYWLMNDRIKQWLRTAFVLPTVVPGLIGIMLWKMIYQPEAGLLNETLRALGLSQLTRPWLGDEQFAIWAIVFAGFPWISVFPFLIFLGGLIHVPQDVFEAASVDGISIWRRLWAIDLPLIRPQMRLLLTFTFIGCIQDFTSVLVFTMGGPGNSTFVPALQMFLQTAQSSNMGYASAIGVFLFVLVLIATGLNLILFRTERE